MRHHRCVTGSILEVTTMDKAKAQSDHRIERDSMGEVRVPAHALYGAQTQRAVENFTISGLRFPPVFIDTLAMIKEACALVNRDMGRLEPELAGAIAAAAAEVQQGRLNDQFPLDIFQTGSGTSTNMNANEVIAALATRRLGRNVHPNDHVNRSQSSNDVIRPPSTSVPTVSLTAACPCPRSSCNGPRPEVSRSGSCREDRAHAPDGRGPYAPGTGSRCLV